VMSKSSTLAAAKVELEEALLRRGLPPAEAHARAVQSVLADAARIIAEGTPKPPRTTLVRERKP